MGQGCVVWSASDPTVASIRTSGTMSDVATVYKKVGTSTICGAYAQSPFTLRHCWTVTVSE
ncbi:MAG: hypothetical protein HYV63_23020 [Candidatus Schekmanbacteria bacterium]|nr:hypothetical protein [Candidatus Schekmanbacteria bacterium]